MVAWLDCRTGRSGTIDSEQGQDSAVPTAGKVRETWQSIGAMAEAPIKFQILRSDGITPPECRDAFSALLEWTNLIEGLAEDMCSDGETVALLVGYISAKGQNATSVVMATPPAARAVAQYASAVAENSPSSLDSHAEGLLGLQRHLKNRQLSLIVPKQRVFTESILRAELKADTVDFGELKAPLYREPCDLYGEPVSVSVSPGRVWLKVRGESRRIKVSLPENEARAIARRIGAGESGQRVLIHGIGTYRVTDHCLMRFEVGTGLDVGFTDRPDLNNLDEVLQSELVAGRPAVEFHRAMAMAREEGSIG